MIEFCHVDKFYDGRFHALTDVSLFVDKAEFVLLTGVSGAGKTTLLKHIYMEEFPSTGQVFVCGFDSKYLRRRDIPKLRRKLGIVFQDFRLLHDRDVFDNVAFAARIVDPNERRVKRKVFDALTKTGLSHKCSHMPNQLSGGEQQRVCLARAIVNDPQIVLADEPTGNLDVGVSEEIFSLLRRINSWGTTVMVATHDIHLIDKYHYRKLVLERGELTSGSLSPVKQRFPGVR